MAVDQPIGEAVLHVASDVQPDVRDAFARWCDTVHHFDTMRVDGFLGLRRLELVEAASPELAPALPVLTLYQVAQAKDADFSSPSYQRHSASYAPPPPEVVDGIRYERTVYRRVGRAVPGSADAAVPRDGAEAPPTTQQVGGAALAAVGRTRLPDDQVAEGWASVVRALAEVDGVLGSHLLVQADVEPSVEERRVALIVEVDDVASGRRALEAAGATDLGERCDSAALFGQVFPTEGVLLRDRAFAT